MIEYMEDIKRTAIEEKIDILEDDIADIAPLILRILLKLLEKIFFGAQKIMNRMVLNMMSVLRLRLNL